jgi:hypothetical protein
MPTLAFKDYAVGRRLPDRFERAVDGLPKTLAHELHRGIEEEGAKDYRSPFAWRMSYATVDRLALDFKRFLDQSGLTDQVRKFAARQFGV